MLRGWNEYCVQVTLTSIKSVSVKVRLHKCGIKFPFDWWYFYTDIPPHPKFARPMWFGESEECICGLRDSVTLVVFREPWGTVCGSAWSLDFCTMRWSPGATCVSTQFLVCDLLKMSMLLFALSLSFHR